MDSVDRWPIVYSPQYNVKFCGFEKLHPFDAAKWGKVVQFLIEESLITNNSIHEPSEIGTDDLLKVHTKRYINSLNWSYKVAYVVEMPLVAIIPNCLIQKLYLKSMRFQVGGSVLAGKLALENGWSINVGGGFHHCSGDKGGGYCPYADITLLLHELFDNHENVRKAMIVDLDAHQGNGHETDFKGDNRVYIMDIYNANLYPHDGPAKEAIHCQVELENHIPDSEYLPLVEKNLEKSLSSFHPDIIVYNAGTDILEGDPLGKLSITPEGILNRDKIVFMKARERRIPIVMLTSGGYQKSNARIIANSILNLANLGLIGPAERRQRIFNDKERLIGVDKLALENQVKERRMNEQQERMYEDVVQKNLVFYSEQAVQQEQLVKCLSAREAELHRQLENKLLAQEQRSRINRMNEAAFSNIPTNDYYSYFNTSSR